MSLKRKRDMSQIFRSRALTFIIGKDQVEHTGHEIVFLALSPSFKNFIKQRTAVRVDVANRVVNRKHSSLVTWSDIEPATFVNLTEYAYSRDYTVPALSQSYRNVASKAVKGKHGGHDMPGPESDAGTIYAAGNVETSTTKSISQVESQRREPINRQNTQQPEIPSLYMWMRSASRDSQSQQHSSARYKLCETLFPIPSEAAQTTTEDWLDDVKQHHRTGYKEVFLAHAELYLVANRFSMTELKELCLHKLRQSLLHAPRTDEMLRATIDTIRHVYANIESRDNDLRKLLVHFCLTDMEWMTRDENLELVLESVPAFAIDLFREIAHEYCK
ncbi:uncharacterized protein BDZ83DRAFT_797487 [Colletotrichum acutatum]|uniref:BTB domain-containing protein n=1 Tax=Glomerella acutata TaxID=27357 RepID=A0AAD8UB19_GLOAC|nr:uncharacterized protein BDZ83DRAFT_797487 [Colletotrichum acutatum]KAK1708418.1 hypothetical protein BDZ83DRAFT_797487 [Colletotrichum acutatum]